MRIALYKDSLANGRGADVAVQALAAGLRERGYRATLFEKGELAARLKEHWDVVVLAGTNELLDLAAAFPHGFPWPVVQQFHTNPRSQFKRKRLIRNWRIRRALRRVAAIQVLADAFRRQVSKYGPPVTVIGNWSELAHRIRDLKDVERGAHAIIYPAAFGGRKNHELLIRAFASLQDEFPDWTLELYGRGTPPANLPPRVKCMGYCNIENAYRRCAFVAFPSLDEGFPLSLVEAAAFARPAVAVADWIGVAAAGGGIVTAPTVPAYAQALRRLMSDSALRADMGEQARRFCQASFAREKILDAWSRLLDALCGNWNATDRA